MKVFPIRHGNIRRALRAVAKAEGVELKRVRYKHVMPMTDRPGWALGSFDSATRDVELAKHYRRVRDGLQLKRTPTGTMILTAGHELAHAHGFEDWRPFGKRPAAEDVQRRYGKQIAREAMRLSKLEKIKRDERAARKSAAGGEVQVSAHERDGHAVAAYTRSRPS